MCIRQKKRRQSVLYTMSVSIIERIEPAICSFSGTCRFP